MNRIMAVGLTMILSFSLISCSSRCRKLHLDSTPKVDHSRQNESKLAYKRFLNGKAHYLNFSLASAVEAFEDAISYESPPVHKSRTYIYLGASYFYLNDFQSANKYFSKAKRLSPSVTPPSSDFPWEILKAYENAP
jgi:tetratricopeptide (TPR) repeat protein